MDVHIRPYAMSPLLYILNIIRRSNGEFPVWLMFQVPPLTTWMTGNFKQVNRTFRAPLFAQIHAYLDKIPCHGHIKLRCL